MYLSIALKVIGGVGIFLYGMDNMSKGMQSIAGDKLKKILALLTTNRFMAVFMGIFVTGLVQSSTVSTVMTIGFLNASLLTLKQALGVILGANIGSTITGWMLALKIGIYGLPLAGLAIISTMIFTSEKARIRANTVMGLGLLFFGLQIMGEGLDPIRTMPEFVKIFHAFTADSYFGILKAALVGAVLTAIVQSSAATLGITITLASQGLIDYPTAVALVLGENVGTTLTAYIASINGSANARRAAYAHIIINLVGVLWATSIFSYYIIFLEKIINPEKDIIAAIASGHTIFNVINVCLFVPFIGYLAKFLDTIVKSDSKKKVVRVTHLDALMIETPLIVVSQTEKEILNMGHKIKEGFAILDRVITGKEEAGKHLNSIQHIEEHLDLCLKEISDINFMILNGSLDAKNVKRTRENLVVCDEYETLSDYLFRIAKALKKLEENDVELNEYNRETLSQLHKSVQNLFNDVNVAFEKRRKDDFIEIFQKCSDVKGEYLDARREHLDHISEDEPMPAMLSTRYMDLLTFYRRMKDHIANIAEIFVKID